MMTIYIVSGAAGAGKTILTEKLHNFENITSSQITDNGFTPFSKSTAAVIVECTAEGKRLRELLTRILELYGTAVTRHNARG